MRRTLILTLAVLLGALAVCAASLMALNGAVAGAQRLERLATQAGEAGEPDRAKALVAELGAFWRERADLLELLASHDALHDVDAAIAEAAICLACEDRDDFLCAMSEVRMGLEHLAGEEALRLSNLY